MMTGQKQGQITQPTEATPLVFTYKNWRGEISERSVYPLRVEFGATEWHPEPQWLLFALDIGKGDYRSFAMKDIVYECAHFIKTEQDLTAENARLREALDTAAKRFHKISLDFGIADEHCLEVSEYANDCLTAINGGDHG